MSMTIYKLELNKRTGEEKDREEVAVITAKNKEELKKKFIEIAGNLDCEGVDGIFYSASELEFNGYGEDIVQFVGELE